MESKLKELIKYHSENNCLDFKKEQYPIDKHNPKKHEIIKDFIAFANNPVNEDKFIIIGIKEKGGVPFDFFNIDSINDEAYYQEYLNKNVEPKILFEYKNFKYNDYTLCYFRLYNNNDRPYLIKKTIQNASPNIKKTEFKEGDGFIRIGTSTRRLLRNDFDEIYNKKNESPDRKSDIKINAYSNRLVDSDLKDLNLKYIDIEVENISNKSIEFDIEMSLKKNDEITFISLSELEKEYEKKANYGLFIPSSNINYNNLRVEFINQNPVIIRRVKLMNQKNAIRLQQNSKKKNIFCNEIIILNHDNYNNIEAEIIIRSDDFSKGLLKQKITIPI